MQITLSAFAEDNPDAADLSRVVVPVGDEVAQVSLQQLGPVDALEDVQRRARRLDVQTRRPQNSLRRSGFRPRFLPVNGLPKVEDASSASSTMVAYLLRPFSSPKDAERQLGPIGIIETSYRGASHSHVPSRMVVALEDPADSLDDSFAGASSASDAPPLGVFGSSIAERLRHRGVEVPVFSLERRRVKRHRWLIEHIASVMMSGWQRASSSSAPVPSQLGAPCTNMLTAGGLAHLASSLMSEAGEEASVSANSQCHSEGGSESGRSTGQQYRRIRPNAQARGHSGSSSSTSSWRSEPVIRGADRAFGGGSSALGSARSGGKEDTEAWRWEAPPAPPRSFSAPRPLSPSGTMTQGVGPPSTRGTRAKERDAHSSSIAQEDEESRRVLKALPCAARSDMMAEPVEAEVRTQADVEASEAARARAVELTTKRALAGTSSTTSNTTREAVAAHQQNDDKTVEAAAWSKAVVPSFSTGREEAIGQQVTLADAEVDVDGPQAFLDGEDAADLPAPVVQVGDLRFCLPPPALAVQRITELWRPGACMVVITTQHYGTPLLCPDGDIMKGLVNIAPSAEGGQQLVPLFWQNVEEEVEQGNGHLPPEQDGELAAMNSGALYGMSRGSQLPTMVEEEEEEEDDDSPNRHHR